ncbi:LacI family DNA-binding transcriptional regulator [Polaromonas sp. JS666]|uniref:LacI family DNA-binding transcriptional regulator n=1 Tax=Polaromonas sp. (strain JS666 / ATCC BAA-500) TaxID=296591 RepID=UPI0000D5B34D|nr:LacI family DNA-binding transcriptional regulator [Polaromonas sp. JS666]ABE42308.1 transcriptional regulator, LacI family [Polaromonas sp. JS666]
MNLKELAKSLGVHASTVSRVLNPATRHMVGKEVAAKVLAAAARHNFTPNNVASSLRTRRSNIVGIVLPDISNPVFPPILLGIETELRKHGLVALLANGGEDPKQQRTVVDQLLARQVDALILATATRKDRLIDHCLSKNTVVVTINRGEDHGRVSSVMNDELLGMRLAFDHLVSLGHTEIVHIVGPQNLSTGYLRRAGFIQAAVANGWQKSKLNMVDCTAYTREAGRVACQTLLKTFPKTTAVLAGNDLVALGCYDVLLEKKIKCPRDMSIVGYNDMPFVDLVSPALTTVRIRHHEMGIQAAQLILRRIQQGQDGEAEIRLKPELVVRQSTRSPRKQD